MPGLKTLDQRVAYVAKVRAGFEDKSVSLSHDLYTGKINLDTWERYMRREITAMHTASLIISRGGDPKAITPADLKALNGSVKEQYKYLAGFKNAIGARAYLVETGKGDFFSEQYLANRSRLYGGPISATFFRSFAYNLLPFVPRDVKADTECDGACKCTLEFKQGPSPEIIHVFWRMDYDAEHCPSCIRLSGEWNPYVLTLPEGLSAADWARWLPRMRVHEDEAIADGLDLAAATPEARSEATRKAWLSRKRKGQERVTITGEKRDIYLGKARLTEDDVSSIFALDGHDVHVSVSADLEMGGARFEATYTKDGQQVAYESGNLYHYKPQWRDEPQENGFHISFMECTDQGTGMARNLLASQFDSAKERGFDFVDLQADVEIGRYAWAKIGFDYMFPTDSSRASKKFATWAEKRGVPKPDTGWPQFKSAKDVAEYRHPAGHGMGADNIKCEGIRGQRDLHLGKAFMLDHSEDAHGGWDARLWINQKPAEPTGE